MAGRPDGIVDDIASQVRPGSIVLAHDTGSDDRLITIDRLPAIIRRLRDDGYTFATVSDLLATSSGQRDDGRATGRRATGRGARGHPPTSGPRDAAPNAAAAARVPIAAARTGSTVEIRVDRRGWASTG